MARVLAKNQVVTCGISERRFIQGDRPEAGAELAMTDRELTHLFLRVAETTLLELATALPLDDEMKNIVLRRINADFAAVDS